MMMRGKEKKMFKMIKIKNIERSFNNNNNNNIPIEL